MELEVSCDTICVPSKDVVACEIEGKMILVPLVAGVGDCDSKICTLSETGWAIWKKLNQEQTLGQVAEALKDEFSSTADEISRDVFGFVTEMIRYKTCILLNDERLKQYLGSDAEIKNCKRGKNWQRSKPMQSAERPLSKSKYINHGGELHLSNPGQLALLHSMKEQGVALRTMVRGFSMNPFIKDCDVLTIVPLDEHRPGIGDVVAFSHPKNDLLFIHRVIKKTVLGWLMKGDNRLENDGYISSDRIIGLVTRIERNGRKVCLGLGIERKWIAFLNRGKGLFYLKLFFSIPRQTIKIIKNSISR